MAKNSSHAQLCPVECVPADLNKDLPDGREPEENISRVRTLSNRVANTLSSIFARDEGDGDQMQLAPSQNGGTVRDKSYHTLWGRVFFSESFSSMDPVQETATVALTASDLSTHRIEAVRGMAPLSAPPRTASRLQERPNRRSAYSPPYGQIDQYQKLEKVGEGSYATVYKGISRVSDLFVALKEIRLQEAEGIPFTAIREASLLKELNHVNIVRLHDIIPTKEHLILVFEYLDTDLYQFLEERPFGVHLHNSKLLLFQLLRGLAFIHARKILHRDIKPQNLLLSKRGELKLADFGLARAKSVPSHTYTHEVVTLWYRPPDVLLGSRDYTTSLDIWGAGCIFVEMISGFPLFPGVKSAADQLTRIFKVLGTPSAQAFPQLQSFDCSLDDFPKYPGEPLFHQAPRLNATPHGEQIASAMLKLNPKERISAADAMKHAYFGDMPQKVYLLDDTVSILEVAGIRMCDDPKQTESSKISVIVEGSGPNV